MWPWEHVAFGYLLVSLYSHTRRRTSPDGAMVLAAGFGAMFPDLVDKPLSWTFGIFESGYAVAHSIFTLPVLAIVVLGSLRPRGLGRLGAAFLVGHTSHLVGDIIYPALLGDPPAVTAILWPLVQRPASEAGVGFLAQFVHYFGQWAVRIRALEFGPLLLFEAVLAVFVLLVWVYDGTPVLAEVRRRLQPERDV
ncbi:MAG: metal-dependent hydrolase [Halobacteriota archaeon]